MKKYMDDTLQYYDKNAEEYYQEWNKKFVNDYDFNQVTDTFLNYLKPNSTILDLGCGTGRDSLYFKSKNYKVTAVDGSSEMCKIASSVLGDSVKQVNFLDIDYENEFDGIFACASLLHLSDEDLVKCLHKVVKASKDKGILYISFKYGEEVRVKEGRFFNDMTEEKFKNIYSQVPELEFIKVFSNSQYENHRGFINFILGINKA